MKNASKQQNMLGENWTIFDIKIFLLRANFQSFMRNTNNHIDGGNQTRKSISSINYLLNLAEAGTGVVFDVHTR